MLPYLLLPFLESYNPYLFSPCGGNSGVIMGELLVSKSGLGYLILYGSQVFNINLVITGVVILGILSYLMYLIIDIIEVKVKKKMGINI